MICTPGITLGPSWRSLASALGDTVPGGGWVGGSHGPLEPQGVPTSEAVPPCPHTPFSHGAFDTVSLLYLWPHGSTSSIGSQGLGVLGGWGCLRWEA